MSFPYSEVSATGLGAWPGTDPEEASKISLGLLTPPNLPYLPQLPGRGVGSDAIGRTASLLVELPVDVQPYGWRFVDRPGQDLRRANSAFSTDINVLADVAGGSSLEVPELKVGIVGPLSLASQIHLHYGERSLIDYGARRDVGESLAAGLPNLARRLMGAVPGAQLTLQIDEPFVAAIAAGTIPTVSGYRSLRSVPASEIRQSWRDFTAAARAAGFENVALNVGQLPVASLDATDAGESAQLAKSWTASLALALESEVDAVALSLQGLNGGHWEQLAGAVESGIGVWGGAVPISVAAGASLPPYAELVERVLRPWRGLGLSAKSLNLLRITPQDGLAELSPAQGRAVMNRTMEVAAALTDARNN